MQLPLAPNRTPLLRGACEEECPREGRNCDRCHRLTAVLLFPRLNARPGRWLLFLAGVCSFVAIRALELVRF